jgi:hypothetical protein
MRYITRLTILSPVARFQPEPVEAACLRYITRMEGAGDANR